VPTPAHSALALNDTVVEGIWGEAWSGPIDAAWTRLLADLDFYVKHPDQSLTAA